MAAEAKIFRDICCGKLGIPKEAFEKTVLLACLPGYYRWLGLLRWHLNPSYFERDLEVIRAAAECTNLKDINAEITYYHHRKVSSFQRNTLRFRLSGQRLLRFAKQFLPQN